MGTAPGRPDKKSKSWRLRKISKPHFKKWIDPKGLQEQLQQDYLEALVK